MSGVLVDTHVALWWSIEPERLTRAAYARIEDPDCDVWLSAISLAEIAIKTKVGKLRDVPADFPQQMLRGGFRLLALSPEHAWRLNDVPANHGDPFDRLLIAQALFERMPMVSADRTFAEYDGLELIW